MAEKLVTITREPLPLELIVEYLMLPETLPGCRVSCYRYDNHPEVHCIQFRRIHNRNLWQFKIAYDNREAELLRYRDDIFKLRWHDAIRQLREASE
jgi:hypothetical protein